MLNQKVDANAIKSFALLVVLGTAYQAMAQDSTTPYPNMTPNDQCLMTDQGAEIALARSGAPESIFTRCRGTGCWMSRFRESGQRQKRFRLYPGTFVDFCT